MNRCTGVQVGRTPFTLRHRCLCTRFVQMEQEDTYRRCGLWHISIYSLMGDSSPKVGAAMDEATLDSLMP